MIISRPLSPNEPDLLQGREKLPLRFICAAGAELANVHAPSGGWTHDGLEAATPPDAEPWNAYLGEQWVGSSEL